jgi:hypothetical protein
MKTCLYSVLGIALAALTLGTVQAEVTHVEITSRQDVLGGKTFGTVGAYELLTGKVYFAVDPKNPHDRVIADVDKAPLNKQGKVEFSSDLFILTPKDPSRGNGVLFFDIVNRGNKQLLSTFDLAKGNDPSTEDFYGDGMLLNQGYTLVAVGWEFDTPKKKNLILADIPVATENGKPITGWVHPWFIPDKKSDSYEFASGEFTPAYPPADPNNADYRLTEREGYVAAPRLIPRADWQFGHLEDGKVVFDPKWVTMRGGFKPGMTYEVSYESQNPPVAGLGFAAVRDMASELKYNPDAIVHGKYVYTYGASQTGRWERQMIYQGFTTDEQGRQVVDAVFVQTGGTSFGSFNERFAQPSELGSWTQTSFPIRYETTTDPVTGKKDGVGAKVPTGMDPKIFLVDTGSEYWDRGRVAALRHLSMDGSHDLPDPPNMRIYSYASARHGSGSWPPPASEVQQQLSNPNDYRFGHRALLMALDGWVRNNTEPPPSKHPLLADGTLIQQSNIKFPNISGVEWPYHVPGGYRTDLPGVLSVLPFLVPKVDSDGNDIAGIRMPEQAVPLGTYTDWAFRSEAAGSPNTTLAMAGSFIPFAKTRAAQEKNHDPRKSLEERYSNRAGYLSQVTTVSIKMAQQRYLLQSDIQTVVQEAGEHWDWIMSQNAPQAEQ